MILAAVGELQFDVVRFRLESEYNTPTTLSMRSFKLARWMNATPEQLNNLKLPYGAKLVKDQYGHHAVLLQSEWDLQHVERENPRFALMRFAFRALSKALAEQAAAKSDD